MDKHGRLLSAKINGRDVDPKASYRIVTLDYIAQGNDKMEAFKAKTAVVSPQSEENNVRYLIMDYFRNDDERRPESGIKGRRPYHCSPRQPDSNELICPTHQQRIFP